MNFMVKQTFVDGIMQKSCSIDVSSVSVEQANWLMFVLKFQGWEPFIDGNQVEGFFISAGVRVYGGANAE